MEGAKKEDSQATRNSPQFETPLSLLAAPNNLTSSTSADSTNHSSDIKTVHRFKNIQEKISSIMAKFGESPLIHRTIDEYRDLLCESNDLMRSNKNNEGGMTSLNSVVGNNIINATTDSTSASSLEQSSADKDREETADYQNELEDIFANMSLTSAFMDSPVSVVSQKSIPATLTTLPSQNEDAVGQPKPQTIQDFMKQYKESKEQEIANCKSSPPKSLFNKERVPRAILDQTRLLPIHSRKDDLINLVRENQFIIVIGETGSGKSTQLPQYLAEAGLHGGRKIGVTQPRRVAAKSLADRVAVECGVATGSVVGYAVRFDKKVSGETVIKYMTDGLLVKECASEANLDAYSIIIIDEAHERSIHTDVCFGLLKRAARRRPDLKVIISSATLDERKFSRYFNNAPIFNVSGKGFPVKEIYIPKNENEIIQGAVDTIIDINRREPRGDILVFLSGQDEIEQVWDMLDKKLKDTPTSLDNELIIIPCYGGLPFDDQQKIFEETPANCRKVVLATNIAETSLTINGIVYVIDCGYFKQNQYNPKSGICSLVKQRITRFQAIQRSGRAGRTRAGKCYRLYSQRNFNYFLKQSAAPEITRCNVASVVLDIISMGIANPLEFEFMDPPRVEALAEAIEHLQELSALDKDLKLTSLGRRMSEFPLSPPLAKVVIESEKLGCSNEVLKIVGILSTHYQSIFIRSRHDKGYSEKVKAMFNHPDGDLITLLKVFEEWQINNYSENWCQSLSIQYRRLAEAEDIRVQLYDILQSRGMSERYYGENSCPPHLLYEHIRRAFTAGYFRQLAKKKLIGHGYQVLGDMPISEDVYLHPSSSVFYSKHPWVIYHEVMKTTKAFMRGVTSIEPSWISEYAPEFAKKVARLGLPVRRQY